MSMGVKSMDLESLVGNVIQTTSNVGGDVGLALPIIVNDAPFRGLTAGPNVVLTVLGDSSVEIASIDTSQSPLTTKGDIWGYSGIDARIPIGAQDQVLTVDSAQPLGLKWSDPKDNIPAFQTPWLQQIDADGFSLTDLSNIIFRNTTGNPGTGSPAIFAESSDMFFQTTTTNEFIWKIGPNIMFKVIDNAIDLTGSSIQNVAYLESDAVDVPTAGTIRLGAADSIAIRGPNDNQNLTIGTDAAGMLFNIPDNVDRYTWKIGGNEEMELRVNTLIMNGSVITAISRLDSISGTLGAQGFLRMSKTDEVTWGNQAGDNWNGLEFEFDVFDIKFDAVDEYSFTDTQADFKNNKLFNVNPTTITDFTTVTAEAGDFIWIIDGTDGLSKKVNASDFFNGEDNTASNVGSGVGVFKQKVLADLEFKSLLANTEILIANNVDDLAFSIGAIAISKITSLQTELDSKIETITNVGAGVGIANAKVGQNVDLQSLVAGTDISVISNGTEITITNTRVPITPTTASNLGGGEGVFAQKVLEDLEFKSLADTTEILVSSTATEISMLVGAIAISQVTGLQAELDSLTGGSRKIFLEKRQISVYPGDAANLELVMIGSGNFTDEGDLNQMFDVDGYYIEFRVTTDMGAGDGGFFCTDSVRRDLNFDVTVKFRCPAVLDRRLWIGFLTADPSGTDNPITEHIALRLSTGATNVNFVISHADGVTQAETQLAVADTAIHTIRIVSDEANSKFQYSFDGAALADLTTNIPAATTNLDCFSEVYALAGGILPHYDFWWLDGVADA